jgi:hypothetical protein
VQRRLAYAYIHILRPIDQDTESSTYSLLPHYHSSPSAAPPRELTPRPQLRLRPYTRSTENDDRSLRLPALGTDTQPIPHPMNSERPIRRPHSARPQHRYRQAGMFDQMALQKTHTHTHTRMTYHQKPQDACKPLTVDRCHCAREIFQILQTWATLEKRLMPASLYFSAQPFHRRLLLAHANCAQLGLSPLLSLPFFVFANGHHHSFVHLSLLYFLLNTLANTSTSHTPLVPFSSSLNAKSLVSRSHIHTHAQPHRSRRPDRKGSAELPVSGERGWLGYVRLRAGLIGSR